MKGIVESNFQCCDLWAQRDYRFFRQFLLYRKKRLSATFILLCDSCLNKEVLTPERLDLIEEIGSIVEIISITGHDLVKRKEGEPNTYDFWLGSQSQQSEKIEFLKAIQNILVDRCKGSKELKKAENQAEIREIFKNVGNVLKGYYGFNEFDELLKTVVSDERSAL